MPKTDRRQPRVKPENPMKLRKASAKARTDPPRHGSQAGSENRPKEARRRSPFGLPFDITEDAINSQDSTAQPIEGKGVGFQPTTLGEMLSLDEPTMRIIDLKISLVRSIRRLRSDAKMTQATLAKKLGVSQPRIVEIESSKPNTTLDALIAAFFAVGGTGVELGEIARQTDESMSF